MSCSVYSARHGEGTMSTPAAAALERPNISLGTAPGRAEKSSSLLTAQARPARATPAAAASFLLTAQLHFFPPPPPGQARPAPLRLTHRAPADERVSVGILHQRPQLGQEGGHVAASAGPGVLHASASAAAALPPLRSTLGSAHLLEEPLASGAGVPRRPVGQPLPARPSPQNRLLWPPPSWDSRRRTSSASGQP